MKSLCIVDLSTSIQTAGARIVPLTDYYLKKGTEVTLLINSLTTKTYAKVFGSTWRKISLNCFPFTSRLPQKRIFIGFEYLKKILLSPFVKLDKKIDVIYSLTGIICDVFPGYYFKLRYKKIWVANIDNIEAPPAKKPGPWLTNLFAYLLFRFSLFLIRSADAVFVTTPLNEVMQVLIKSGIKRKRIHLSNNGIPFKKISHLKAGPGKYDAVFMSRIHEGKGIFDLICIWEKVLLAKPSACNLLVIGSGEEAVIKKTQNLIREKNLSKSIKLVGFWGGIEKYQFLKQAKIFLYPSHYDANPISTVEAMACGLPIVAYDLPIFKQYYPRDTIITVPMLDLNQFSNQVLHLLNKETLRKKYSSAGLNFAKEFDWDEIFQKQEKIISKL